MLLILYKTNNEVPYSTIYSTFVIYYGEICHFNTDNVDILITRHNSVTRVM